MTSSPKKKFMIFALITGIFGFLAGILTAPKSGKETRKDISKKAVEIKAESIEKLSSVEAELADLVKRLKGQTNSLNAKARAEFNEASIRARDAQNKSKTVLKAIKTGKAENSDLDEALGQSKAAIKSLKKYLKS